MRLGVLMTGTGAHAAVSFGVLSELRSRGIEPFAVCGLQTGAWPAALYAAGLDMQEMKAALDQAAAAGRSLTAPSAAEWTGMLLGRQIMHKGRQLERLLYTQTGRRVLSLCPGAALFPCRMSINGQRVMFSTRAYMQPPGVILAMQAALGYAARASMALPPFLEPLSFMGSPLLGETDTAYACRQLTELGAQRILAVVPYPCRQAGGNALDLAGAMLRMAGEQPLGSDVGVLNVSIPDRLAARSWRHLGAISEAGRMAAARELDDVFERMGMAFCRVLPFGRHAALINR